MGTQKWCRGAPFLRVFIFFRTKVSGKPRVHAPLAMAPQGAHQTLGKPQIFTSDTSAVTERMKPSQGGLTLHKHTHTQKAHAHPRTRGPSHTAPPLSAVSPSGPLSKPHRPYRINSNLARPLPRHAPTAAWAVFRRSLHLGAREQKAQPERNARVLCHVSRGILCLQARAVRKRPNHRG